MQHSLDHSIELSLHAEVLQLELHLTMHLAETAKITFLGLPLVKIPVTQEMEPAAVTLCLWQKACKDHTAYYAASLPLEEVLPT